MNKGNNIPDQLEHSWSKKLANQRPDGDDTGSDEDRMVICETQDDSSQFKLGVCFIVVKYSLFTAQEF